MKNIFSKYRTHILYNIRPKFKKIIIITLLMTFNITFWITFKNVDQNFKPTVTALASSYSTTHTISIINRACKEMPAYDYSKICQINKNENGEILSITTKTSEINKIKLNLSQNIIEKINNTNYKELGIPIGNLTNTYIFMGRGPKIPIRIIGTSIPKITVDNKFEDAGINQTKHKISLITSIDIQIVLPYETVTKTVNTETMICETIIVGKVPNVYISK